MAHDMALHKAVRKIPLQRFMKLTLLIVQLIAAVLEMLFMGLIVYAALTLIGAI